jgi:hypothetical protein
MSFSMVGETWDHVPYCWISCMSNVGNFESHLPTCPSHCTLTEYND